MKIGVYDYLGKKVLPLLFIFSLLCTSCQQGTQPFYIRSSRAGGSGEKSNVVDVTIAQECMKISDPNVITITIGMGGDMKQEAHKNETMILKIEADGCLINGIENSFEKEYTDYFENESFRATVKDNNWSYPTKTPNYFEDFELTLPSGECKGQINITLYIKEDLYEGYTAEVIVYYASNSTVIWFNDRALREVDQNNRPISVDQKR